MHWLARILVDSWKCYCSRFLAIMVNILVIWTPIEAISAYLNYFVFTENELKKSVQVYYFLRLFFGVICDGAIIAIGIDSFRGRKPAMTDEIVVSLKSWGRLIFARILASVFMLAGLILFFVPGIYVAIRLMFVDQVVVAEGLPPRRSCKRSFELTRQKFWPLAVIFFLAMSCEIAAYAAMAYSIQLLTSFDHWMLEAGISVIAHFAFAYGLLCLTFAYAVMASPEVMNPERSDSNPSQSLPVDLG